MNECERVFEKQRVNLYSKSFVNRKLWLCTFMQLFEIRFLISLLKARKYKKVHSTNLTNLSHKVWDF